MTTITNERKTASIRNESDGLTLIGKVRYGGENGLIDSFFGNVYDGTEGNYHFSYSEPETNRQEYTVNAPNSIYQQVESLMLSTVIDIHNQVTNNN